MSGVIRALTAGLMLSAAAHAGAQTPAKPAAEKMPPQMQARQQIAAFEGALENAVRHGAQMLNQRMQASNADYGVMLAGLTRARGFRLDDYGVLFDVECPSMRRSMVWTMQELGRTNAAAGGGRAVQAAEAAPTVRPREIYQTEMTTALVDAIVDYPGTIGVTPTEWLTVAARESVRFVPGDPNDTAITVILRIKGSDLQALRERKISREEARSRVEVKHY